MEEFEYPAVEAAAAERPRISQIAVLGDLCLDIDVIPFEDSENYFNKYIQELYMSLAGSAGNAAVALSAMGYRVKLIAPAAEDLTYSILDVIGDDIENLEIHPIRNVAGSTCFIVNIIDQRGVRRIFTYRGPTIQNFNEVKEALSTGSYRALYVSGYILELLNPLDLIEFMDEVSKRIKVRVFDLFPRIKSFKDYVKELLPKFTIVTGNYMEFNSIRRHLWPEPVKYLLNRGSEIVIVKMGGKGAKAYTAEETYRVTAYKTPIRYLKGAGDVFSAVFLGSYLRDGNIRGAMNSASYYASMHVSGKTILGASMVKLV